MAEEGIPYVDGSNGSTAVISVLAGALPIPKGNTSNETDGDEHLDAITRTLMLYVAPVLLVLGLLGNSFSIIVLNSKRMRQSRCCFPLTALAGIDITVLFTGLLRLWIHTQFGIDLRSLGNAPCKIHTYLSYITRHLSSWTLLLLAVERLVSVYAPFRAREWCSKRRTFIGWCLVVVIICLLNSPLLWLKEIQNQEREGNITVKICNYTAGQEVSYAVWTADALLLCCIPFVVICVCNVLIVAKIVCCLDKGLQRSKTGTQQSSHVSSMTFMLLLVCFVFLLTTTPIMIFFLRGARYWKAQTASYQDFVYKVCNLIYYTNSVFNFALYCVGGSQFRAAAKEILFGQESCRGCPGKTVGAPAGSDGEDSNHTRESRAPMISRKETEVIQTATNGNHKRSSL